MVHCLRALDPIACDAVRHVAPAVAAAVSLPDRRLDERAFFYLGAAPRIGHSAVALRKQIPIRSITLFIFGGIA